MLAEDPKTGEQGSFEVVAVTNHPTDEVLTVTVGTTGDDGEDEAQSDQTSTTPDVMQVAPDHPVYVEDEGWLLAENLELGDRLRRADGGMAKVLAIERIELDEPQTVYNFTVKGPHTYFVLDARVLVHNYNCPVDFEEELTIHTRGSVWRDMVREIQQRHGLGKDVIYILKNTDMDELLYVGKSTTGGLDRFNEYMTIANRYRQLEQDITIPPSDAKLRPNLEIDVKIGPRLQYESIRKVEDKIRTTLRSQGHELPWDNKGPGNTDRYWGHAGSAVPWRTTATMSQHRANLWWDKFARLLTMEGDKIVVVRVP